LRPAGKHPALIAEALVAAALLLSAAGCGDDSAAANKPKDLTVFHAAGLAPVVEAVRREGLEKLGLRLRPESSGSQVACRKLAELGRRCDLILVADAGLVAELLGDHCSWRIDFANDEVVLAVGKRAPRIAEAERDWTRALLAPGVRLGRVDENQGPIGYRALLVWKLQEKLARGEGVRGGPGLHDALKKKCVKVVDHVARLVPLLKTGEIDYAFVYRSVCVAQDIRYIRLDRSVNLGSVDVDYSAARVSFTKGGAGGGKKLTVKGAPITWALSIPDRGADAESAARFVRWLLTDRKEVLKKNGFRPLAKPRFYGSAESAKPFSDLVRRVGKLEGWSSK
jgi:molybdate/tungstate transport system substrate-binding protein